MHQELSKRNRISPIRLSVFILIIATFLMVLNTIFYDYHVNSSFSDLTILLLVILGTYMFIKKNMVSYKYSLIEDEFFIHEIVGSKEKVVLSIHMDQVEAFESVSANCYNKAHKQDFSTKRKLYNCNNHLNRHYLIYKEDDHKQWITFHPSNKMCEMLQKRLNG